MCMDKSKRGETGIYKINIEREKKGVMRQINPLSEKKEKKKKKILSLGLELRESLVLSCDGAHHTSVKRHSLCVLAMILLYIGRF